MKKEKRADIFDNEEFLIGNQNSGTLSSSFLFSDSQN